MLRLFQFMCVCLCAGEVFAQDVRLFGGYERKGPVEFVDRAIDGVGGGFRFGLSGETFFLDLRAAFLRGSADEASYSNRDNVSEWSVSTGLYKPFDLVNKLNVDIGAELSFSDRQFTQHYLSSFNEFNQLGLALGPAIDLRYRALDIVEPYLALTGTYCISLSENEVYDPDALDSSFEWSLRIGLFLSLPRQGVE